jgi:hypothetical protein
LLWLVAIPLFIRSLADMVFAIQYGLLQDYPVGQPLAADLASVILHGLPTVMIYAGVVLIGTQSDWSGYNGVATAEPLHNPPTYNPGFQNVSYPATSHSYSSVPVSPQPWAVQPEKGTPYQTSYQPPGPAPYQPYHQ